MGKRSRQYMTELSSEDRVSRALKKEEERKEVEHQRNVEAMRNLLSLMVKRREIQASRKASKV